jgi:hypothetical protein
MYLLFDTEQSAKMRHIVQREELWTGNNRRLCHIRKWLWLGSCWLLPSAIEGSQLKAFGAATTEGCVCWIDRMATLEANKQAVSVNQGPELIAENTVRTAKDGLSHLRRLRIDHDLSTILLTVCDQIVNNM